jgi:hypothetical protein
MCRFILSIRWTCVVLCWVYAEQVTFYTEYTLERELIYTEYTLIVNGELFFYTECTLNRVWITLSIRWTRVNFHWVYAEQGLKYTEYTLNSSWTSLSIRQLYTEYTPDQKRQKPRTKPSLTASREFFFEKKCLNYYEGTYILTIEKKIWP